MRSSLLLVGLALGLGFVCDNTAQAQGNGKGNGLSKAFGNVGGKGAANSGLGKASQSMSRAGASMGRGGGLERAGSLSRGPLGQGSTAPTGGTASAPTSGSTHQKQLLIEQRNRDQRLAQAAHLREIAARNGDTELAANADRMEAFAHEHYAQRVEHLGRFGVTDPNLVPASDPTAPTGSPETTATDATSPVAAPTGTAAPTAPTARKNWWQFWK